MILKFPSIENQSTWCQSYAVLTCYGGQCGSLLEVPHSNTSVFIAEAGPLAWSRPRGKKRDLVSFPGQTPGSFPIHRCSGRGNQPHALTIAHERYCGSSVPFPGQTPGSFPIHSCSGRGNQPHALTIAHESAAAVLGVGISPMH